MVHRDRPSATAPKAGRSRPGEQHGGADLRRSVIPIVPWILAVAFGSSAKDEIDRSGARLGGRGLALTGLILGWIALVLWALLLLAVFAF